MTPTFRASVVGGSLGGLAVAHELLSVGADVAVYERSADRTQPRGAGIVMQPEVASLLERLGRSVPSVSVMLYERQQLHRDRDPTRYEAPQWMTAWDTLYDALREPLTDACVRMDSRLTDIQVDGGQVMARFGDGHSVACDFLVGTDGIGSTTRALITGMRDRSYSGYVAFRGLEPESGVPSQLLDVLAERFTLFSIPGMQMLCYMVPGDDTGRRVNWVWYVNTPEAQLERLLLGTSGQRYDNFLPPGELTSDNVARLARLAGDLLPTPFADLVALSNVFLQPVFDLPPTHMIADHVALIGDAAGTVRPHTASGTSKALGDAAGLADALTGWTPPDPLPLVRLQRWERGRLAHLITVAEAGKRLADHSFLGTDGPQFLME